ncbi:hypothetical protein G6O69_03445 [Pseudenhygromyxa sp. WMMC2535]|uniref:hypothetical protein n=1 Tax=Pseudenhygromyxa sp. WMMC2535 TaxID=2712867 RepID=UPI0015580F6F|nr:hypothetical protein [Pseudenhygromyxa sp. WMMC2535]NVB36869.1 hypothetical protein [Pseudenhygromyxa sp. WMMC2535]
MTSNKKTTDSLTANIYTPPYRVDSFFPNRKTPGNVGLCISGGGSRSLVAGMGQLRALDYLQANGASLLSQVKATSTVSGGSWVGATYHFLNDSLSDSSYLNSYIPDQGQLVLSAGPDSSPAEVLDELPEGNIGKVPANKLFSPEALVVQAVLLKKMGTPTSMIWQTLVGLHVLEPYGLYRYDQDKGNSLFSLDTETLTKDVTIPNPALSDVPAALYPTKKPRSFLICNFSMFVTSKPDASGSFELLVPVQSTPYYSSIVGSPDAFDSNGQKPGGGGPTAFAFNSQLISPASDGIVAVSQNRQWALADLIGTSSAFFAEVLENILTTYQQDEAAFHDALEKHADLIRTWFEHKLEKIPHSIVEVLNYAMNRDTHDVDGTTTTSDLSQALSDLRNLVPQYDYWSVLANAVPPTPQPERFADGGDLENTGICGMLAYDDIDSIIACVNSDNPLAPATHGVLNADGSEVPNTRVMISDQIPVLFGYQPYQKGTGYKLYAGDDDPKQPIFRHNQVFPSTSFPELLQGIWESSGNAAGHTNESPAVFSQSLAVSSNEWFGVRGNRQVTVVWVYNNFVNQWNEQLSTEVQQYVGELISKDKFPMYPTSHTYLTAREVNLLANLSAWVIANPQQAPLFQALFSDSNG